MVHSDLGPKRLGLLLELVPKAAIIALLVNPNDVEVGSPARRCSARALGRQLYIVAKKNSNGKLVVKCSYSPA
jgi:ribosome biogenesis protein Tsr3